MKTRTSFTKEQVSYLHEYFQKCRYPDIYTRQIMANVLNLPESKVQVWFQNKRSRLNKKIRKEQGVSDKNTQVQENYYTSPFDKVQQGTCTNMEGITEQTNKGSPLKLASLELGDLLSRATDSDLASRILCLK